MGLIRKTVSVATFGAVKFTSRREADTKNALAQARLAREQASQIKKQAAEPPAPAPPSSDLPWYRQPVLNTRRNRIPLLCAGPLQGPPLSG